MVLEGSDVILEENIKKPKPPVPRFFYEELREEGSKQILAFEIATTAQTQVTLFTIPAEHTLFITGVWLSLANNNIADGSATVIAPAINSVLLNVKSEAHNTHLQSLSQTFCIPLKVDSGIIRLDSSASVAVSAGFSGVLVSKRIS